MSIATGIRGRFGGQSATPAPAGAKRRHRARRAPGSGLLGPGIAAVYLGLIVLIPIAAVAFKSVSDGLDAFVAAITNRQTLAALQLTILLAFVVVAINAVMGTLIAWILVRDCVPGQALRQRTDRPAVRAADDRGRA